MMGYIDADDLCVIFTPKGKPKTTALDGLCVTIDKGEFVSIVGPSGCGKTTFLRVVGGLRPSIRGAVFINGKKVEGPGPDRAMVFQEFALMPWKNVTSNIGFGMKMRGISKEDMAKKSTELIELVGLKGFEKHFPHELSGGMKQRVGIARALAVDPEILLMDEPFASVDAQTREFMQADLLRIWSKLKNTILFVTHSIDEAIFLSDRIIVLTYRPAKLKKVIDVPLSRPRTYESRLSTEFVETKRTIWELIQEESSRAARE